ncbi:ADP-ribosylglycohydrolase [Rhizoctonia solani]|uniref:ADP-ribosylglycohydrolase n=1 Tax=Rhizoctonia solani TaxID=456999 RepID=A0A8H7M7C1_9AGAM|nr:ADP-ribosylglycohydrolase [Rhizoctonia solani]
MSAQKRMTGTALGGALGDAIGLFTEFLSRSYAIELYGPTPSFSLQSPLPEPHSPSLVGIKPDRHSKWLAVFGSPSARPRKNCGERSTDKDFEKDPVGTAVKLSEKRSQRQKSDELVCRYWEGTNRYVAANGALMRTAIIGALLFQTQMEQTVLGVVYNSHRPSSSYNAQRNSLPPRLRPHCSTSTDFVQNYKDHPLKPGAYAPERLSEDQLNDLHIWIHFKCLGAGTWALRKVLNTPESNKSGIFERCITEITMQGGDADTNATVAGSLLGAYLTDTGLPDTGSDPDVLIDGGKGAFTPEELNRRYDELMCEVGKRVNDGLPLPGSHGSGSKGGKSEKDGCIMC